MKRQRSNSIESTGNAGSPKKSERTFSTSGTSKSPNKRNLPVPMETPALIPKKASISRIDDSVYEKEQRVRRKLFSDFNVASDVSTADSLLKKCYENLFSMHQIIEQSDDAKSFSIAVNALLNQLGLVDNNGVEYPAVIKSGFSAKLFNHLVYDAVTTNAKRITLFLGDTTYLHQAFIIIDLVETMVNMAVMSIRNALAMVPVSDRRELQYYSMITSEIKLLNEMKQDIEKIISFAGKNILKVGVIILNEPNQVRLLPKCLGDKCHRLFEEFIKSADNYESCGGVKAVDYKVIFKSILYPEKQPSPENVDSEASQSLQK